MKTIKSVAVIGCGPAGAITIDALVQEGVFDIITVFERREKPGGCWVSDLRDHVQQLPDLDKSADRTLDEPLPLPNTFPVWKSRSRQYRYSDTSIYPLLETNIAAQAMELSQEPIPEQRSEWSVQRHGDDTPFRHHAVVQKYLEGLVCRKGYEHLVQCNTTVERVSRTPTGTWKLVLRKEIGDQDYWWKESLDAVIDASGHYSVPFIPHIESLAEFARAYPSSVEHTKSFRGPEKYRGKTVITVGASISGPDTAAALAGITRSPLHCVVRGQYHPYFGDHAFCHPQIQRHPPIKRVTVEHRAVYFEDGTHVENVDNIILGTGYSWTMHFLPSLEIRNNRIPGLYQHIFPTSSASAAADPEPNSRPTFLFVGAVAAGFTFKVYEWQAVLAARYLAGRVTLPPVSVQKQWEQDRIEAKGDGVPFTALYPKFEEYFEELRELAGEPVVIAAADHELQNREKKSADTVREEVCTNGNHNSVRYKGRKLPKFDKQWRETFDAAHLKRIQMWKNSNRKAEEELGLISQGGERELYPSSSVKLKGLNGTKG